MPKSGYSWMPRVHLTLPERRGDYTHASEDATNILEFHFLERVEEWEVWNDIKCTLYNVQWQIAVGIPEGLTNVDNSDDLALIVAVQRYSLEQVD
ncbi:hypothetical protein HHI36_002763 [Cryptolaemus montrouzieri]|uniref:Uncharacterized protein n=1 Tax=Cryptolaemus montrouzieri TaxID=559131 RepID=A0ABD2PBQ3_9CUCU